MKEQTKISEWEKASFPRDSARFRKPLFGMCENHLESFVRNIDSLTSSLENMINVFNRTDVNLRIAFFSNKVVSNHILKYTAL